MKKIIIYIKSNDQPGLISAISKCITNCKGNIETSKMINLESNFNMIILVSINDKYYNKLDDELKLLSKNYEQIYYRTDIVKQDITKNDDLYYFQMKGGDTEGLVYIFTDYLSSKKINIESLETEIINAPITGHPLFLLKSLINIPEDTSIKSLRLNLEELAEKNNVVVKLNKYNK